MLEEMQILGPPQKNKIRMSSGIYLVNKQTRCFWGSWASNFVGRSHLENLCSLVFVVYYINTRPCVCAFTQIIALGEIITKYTVFSDDLWGDGVRVQGGNGSVLPQSFLFSLAFFIIFIYYSHGDSKNYLDRKLRAIALFDSLFILHKW